MKHPPRPWPAGQGPGLSPFLNPIFSPPYKITYMVAQAHVELNLQPNEEAEIPSAVNVSQQKGVLTCGEPIEYSYTVA